MSDEQQGLNIKKTMVILKAPGGSLNQVEGFLKNRQWAIHSSTNLKEALAFIIQNKPSFVLIAVDHSNKKVRALPKLLLQAFPVCVIAFVEKSNTQSYKMLMESGCEYRINPPMTGPSVERAVNKYIRDQEKAMEEASRPSAAGNMRAQGGNGVQDSGSIKDSGSGDSAGGIVSIKGGKAGAANGGPAYTGSAAGGGGFEASSLANILKAMGGDDDSSSTGDEDSSNVGDVGSFSVDVDKSARDSKNHAPGISMSATSTTKPQGEQNSATDEGGVLTGQNKKARGNVEESEPGSFTQSAGSFSKRKNPDGSLSEDEGSEASDITQEGNNSDPGGMMLNKGRKAKAHSATQGSNQSEGEDYNAGKGSTDGPSFIGAGPLGNSQGSIAGNGQNSDQADGGFNGAGSIGGGPAYSPNHQGKNQGPAVSYNESDYQDPSNPSGGFGNSGNDSNALNFDLKKKKSDFKPIGKEIDNENDHRRGKHDEGGDVVRVRGQGHTKDDNIMVKGAQRALEESVNIRDGQVIDKVESSSSVACIVVESPKFSGYLVAAMGKNRKIDSKFIDTVREKLSKFLKENGEEVNADQGLGIKIKQVDFEDWSVEYADFLRKSVHNGDEVAMAFFPFAQANVALGDSVSAEMGTVRMEDLKGDIPVEFNLYIHLPANNKYVLYTPRGSTFYGNQKDRLGKSGITHMHMKKTEAQDLSKYRAQNYLNSKIEEYEKKKAEKRAAKAA